MTPTEIRELLAAHHLRPSKALGQHFLADPNTAARIVRLAEVGAGDRVVEIGPGVGSLTVGLLDAGAHVQAIELDRHVVPALEDVTAGRDIVITVADALRVDWNAVLGADDSGSGDAWKLVANLPYNVATPIVMQVLESAPMIARMLVMVQREVGERLAAGVGETGYGAVSVKVAYRAVAQVVGRVPPTVFMPPPKVDSALVSLVRRAELAVDVPDPARLFALVNAGFATRRKMLRRALAGVVDADGFARAGIDSSARAETLTLDDWARLARGDRLTPMRVEAFAKLTLELHVTGVRADGYHELDAHFVSIDEPHDSLDIRDAARSALRVDGPFAGAVPDDPSNLALRAAETCGATVEIRLHKGIPPGGGLGGGSADAAAVLVALGGTEAMGAALGADVPFCMRGGAAHVRGIGEQIEPVAFEPMYVVVATPHFGCPTAAVYRAWDELGGPHAEVNDLEPAAHHVEPRLVAFKAAVEEAAGAAAILAGSGSSYAVTFKGAATADMARARVGEAIDGSVWLARTTETGLMFVP